ncbi:MAG: hypothetical protein RLO50_18785 [Azospirillaceae bacterium]
MPIRAYVQRNNPKTAPLRAGETKGETMYLQSGDARLAIRMIQRSLPRGVVRVGQFEDETDRYAVWSPAARDMGSLVERLAGRLHGLFAGAAGRGQHRPA